VASIFHIAVLDVGWQSFSFDTAEGTGWWQNLFSIELCRSPLLKTSTLETSSASESAYSMYDFGRRRNRFTGK
jgi:hypothetical protein